MVSKRRNLLTNYMGEEGIFMAVVQDYNYAKQHLILTDVAIEGENLEVVMVAKHVHVKHIKNKILEKLSVPAVISFKATAYTYTRKYDGEKYRNFSLENVRDIVVIGGRYNGV